MVRTKFQPSSEPKSLTRFERESYFKKGKNYILSVDLTFEDDFGPRTINKGALLHYQGFKIAPPVGIRIFKTPTGDTVTRSEGLCYLSNFSKYFSRVN